MSKLKIGLYLAAIFAAGFVTGVLSPSKWPGT